MYRNHKVSETASLTAAKIFLDNAKELSLLSGDNLLIFDSDITEIEEVEVDSRQPEGRVDERITYLPPIENKSTFKELNDESEIPPIPIFLEGDNRIAKLYMPKGFTQRDLERVAKVIKAYVE